MAAQCFFGERKKGLDEVQLSMDGHHHLEPTVVGHLAALGDQYLKRSTSGLLQMLPKRTVIMTEHEQNKRTAETKPAETRSAWDRSQQLKFTKTQSLLHSILLPLLCVFLLPTIRVHHHHQHEGSSEPSPSSTTSIKQPDDQATSQQPGFRLAQMLGSELLRLPFDRIRLQSGLLFSVEAAAAGAGAGAGVASPSRHDLQEEEQTRVMLMAPAEHRSSYLPAGPNSSPGAPGQQQHMAYVDAHGHETAPASMESQYGADSGQDQQMSGGGAGEQALVAAEGSPSSTSLQARADLPSVRALNVKCEKNHMTVNIVFDRPFYGMVFSKGHYNDQKCVHLGPNSGQTSINFDIHLGKCGMSSSDASPAGSSPNGSGLQTTSSGQQQPNGVFIENTIIIQYDPLVQEIYDQARKLRCTWYDYYEKSVTFRPYTVDMLDAVTANFLGDNIQCWMQIQVGKGPWASEVAGIVKIGQTMTMVLAIKDDENRFDMLVRNCVAHDGKHAPIQLVDEYGCVARPKIMSRFQKVRNFGPAATVVSYAHFQAFKFPDSMSVHFQCVIQVCRFECPEPVCNGLATSSGELGAAAAGATQSLASPPHGSSMIATTSPANNNNNPNQQQQPSSAGQDHYTAAGTELIAAKEMPLPLGYHAHPATGHLHHHHNAQHHQPHLGHNNSSPAGAHLSEILSLASPSAGQHNNVHQLKLDESQGRVQVRLDTSMMASLRPPVSSPASGPLPPHLLHMANNGEPGAAAKPASTAGHAALLAGSRPRQSQAMPSLGGGGAIYRGSGVQQQHYSVPYSQQVAAAAAAAAASRRSTIGQSFNHRMGELAQDDGSPMTAPYESQYPLSLIAAPRGFHSASSNDDVQRRFRRSLNGTAASDDEVLLESGDNKRQHQQLLETRPRRRNTHNKRHSDFIDPNRPTASSSTSVQTQRTIQVVSPDDVAFSLVGLPGDDDELVDSISSGSKRSVVTRSTQAKICFSTGRFIWVSFITLAALAGSIVAAVWVIWRQRAQLEQKISTVYDPTSSPTLCATNPADLLVAPSANGNLVTAHTHNTNIYHRQQEELRQRQNYLARLYSQFTPSSYWR